MVSALFSWTRTLEARSSSRVSAPYGIAARLVERDVAVLAQATRA